MDTIFVTCYQNPDLDGFAGVMAYTELLNRTGVLACAGVFGDPHDEVKWVMEKFQFSYPAPVADAASFSRTVLVDASTLGGLPSEIRLESVIEVIDHRRLYDASLFPRAKLQIDLIGAAATLIVERFQERQLSPSKQSATLLSAAIISNTLNFKAAVTHERDRAAFAWLHDYAALPDDFAHEMFIAKSDLSGEKLISRIRNEYASIVIAGKRLSIIQIEMIGASQLVEARIQEVLQELLRMKTEMRLDYILLSCVELEDGYNLFVTDDEPTQALLTAVFGAVWHNGVAQRPGLILRKEITPLFKEYFEQHSANI